MTETKLNFLALSIVSILINYLPWLSPFEHFVLEVFIAVVVWFFGGISKGD